MNLKVPAATLIACLSILAACEAPTGGSSNTEQTKGQSTAIGFQGHKALLATYSGKSVTPVNNGLAFYLATDGTLHTKQVYHNPGPKNSNAHEDYTPGKATRGKKAAFVVNGTKIPESPALCIPQNVSFPKKDPKRICVTLFKTADGDIYAPEYDTYMTISDGPAAFQSVIHHEGKLRDIPPPVPAFYGNITKYGGVGNLYTQNFPEDVVAQQMQAEFKLYLAQKNNAREDKLNAELAELEQRYQERSARREQQKIEAAARETAEKRRIAAARRAQKEKRCKAETGKSCSVSGGGLAGWLLVSGLKAIDNAMSNSAASTGSGNYTAPTPEPQSSPEPGGVSRSSGGWVTVDGITLGRVSFSYGEYLISCSKGYKSGWGSNSVLGGSFKVDVSNRDEATSILLQACKR